MLMMIASTPRLAASWMFEAVASPEPPLSRRLTFQSSLPVSFSQASKPALTRCSDCAAALA